MASTPPARRRLSTVVTVRRAQSERRYLSPWQTTSAAHASFWHPIMYPPQAVPPMGFHYQVLPNSSGWTRMEKVDHRIDHRIDQRIDHRIDHRIEHRIDHHHHTPRTALIPPAYPRAQHPQMIGKSQLVLSGDLWGTVKHRHRVTPFMPPAQLPPLALGSPMPLIPLPRVTEPQGNIQDKLAHDRLTTFLSEKTPSYRPKSILSCPESPLYESLVSTFSAMDDDVTFPDTEVDHEYQQIPALETLPRKHQNSEEVAKPSVFPSIYKNSASSTHEIPAAEKSASAVKICTLDVRPEKTANNKETDTEATYECRVCNCQQPGISSTGTGNRLSSPLSKTTNGSPLQVSSPSNKSSKTGAPTQQNIASSPEGSISSLSSESDTYQDIDRPPTVIHIQIPSKATVARANSVYENSKMTNSTSVKYSQSFSSHENTVKGPRPRHNSPPIKITRNTNPIYSAKPVYQNESNKGHKKSCRKTPEPTYLPLTIELPETKENPKKPEMGTRRNLLNQVPHIITTLDPPVKVRNVSDWTLQKDVPPLVVNFGSEHSDSDEDEISMDTDSSLTTCTIENNEDDDDASLCLTCDDTTSVYSSIAELYSVIPVHPDTLVYVYKAAPHHRDATAHGIHNSGTDHRIPDYIPNRSDDCSSCDSYASWSDTVSFVEPTYRPTHLSVGSRGHLKIDYSCSWDRLDDYVRTTSPRGGERERSGSGGSAVEGGVSMAEGVGSGSPEKRLTTNPTARSETTNRSSQGRSVEERLASRGPYPLPGSANSSVTNMKVSHTHWEKHSDPVAG